MKIFQVINVRWFNATAWYALYLSKLLVQDGHDVIVLTLENTAPDQIARQWGLKTCPVNLNTTNPLKFTETASKILSLLKEHRPDIVNCHRGDGFILWGLLKTCGFNFKLVRTRGDQRLPKSDFINRWLHAKVADAVVVTNRRMAEHFLSRMKTPERNVWLIHGGVDTATFHFDQNERNRVRKEFGFKDSHHVVGLLGRFDAVKGHKDLIKSIGDLRKRGMEDLRLFLIGFDTAMNSDQIRQSLKENGIEDITSISGKRDDVSACISALDTGVVASLWSEAIPRAALEIMAEQRPLISTDVGVMPDIVPEEAIINPGDSEAMGKLIERISTDEAFKEALLEKQEAIMSQLTGEDFLSRTLNLYKSFLERG